MPTLSSWKLTTLQPAEKFISDAVQVHSKYFKEMVQNSKSNPEERALLVAQSNAYASPVRSSFAEEAVVGLK